MYYICTRKPTNERAMTKEETISEILNLLTGQDGTFTTFDVSGIIPESDRTGRLSGHRFVGRRITGKSWKGGEGLVITASSDGMSRFWPCDLKADQYTEILHAVGSGRKQC